MSIGPVLGVIPARGGSKGILDKNIRLLAGRPLISHAAEAAQASGVIDRLILSTDSKKIAEVARSLGIKVPFLRPSDLAQDDTPMQPVLEHAVMKLEKTGWAPEVVVLLQPTAPLRKPRHLASALEILGATGCDSVVSVVRVPDHYAPHFVFRIVDGRLVRFLPEGEAVTRRQDVVPAYSRDGTVYVVRRDVLMNSHSIYGADCRPLIIPIEESVNLDGPEDWERAERLLVAQTAGNGAPHVSL